MSVAHVVGMILLAVCLLLRPSVSVSSTLQDDLWNTLLQSQGE